MTWCRSGDEGLWAIGSQQGEARDGGVGRSEDAAVVRCMCIACKRAGSVHGDGFGSNDILRTYSANGLSLPHSSALAAYPWLWRSSIKPAKKAPGLEGHSG